MSTLTKQSFLSLIEEHIPTIQGLSLLHEVKAPEVGKSDFISSLMPTLLSSLGKNLLQALVQTVLDEFPITPPIPPTPAVPQPNATATVGESQGGPGGVSS